MEAEALAAAPSIAGPSAATVAAAAVLSSSGHGVDRMEKFATQLAAIPEFSTYGALFRSSPRPTPLTESETEYIVSCTKHTFQKHVVFQFDLRNTINDQLLENVEVIMQSAEDPDPDSGLMPSVEIPCLQLPYDQPGVAYVAFERMDAEVYPTGICM